MTMTTYVNYPGTCLEAFRYYEKHLGGTIGMLMTHAQGPSPDRVPPELRNGVLHARITIGATELMGADIPSAQPLHESRVRIACPSRKGCGRLGLVIHEIGQLHVEIRASHLSLPGRAACPARPSPGTLPASSPSPGGIPS